MNMGAGEYTALGMVIALALGLVEVIRQFAYRKFPRRLPDPNGMGQLIKDMSSLVKDLTDQIGEVNAYHVGCKTRMERLVEMHESFDAQGRPKWWVPPNLESNMNETSRHLEKVAMIMDRHDTAAGKFMEKFGEMIANTTRIQENSIKIIERLEMKLDQIDSHVDQLLLSRK